VRDEYGITVGQWGAQYVAPGGPAAPGVHHAAELAPPPVYGPPPGPPPGSPSRHDQAGWLLLTLFGSALLGLALSTVGGRRRA
jgi:hypothetical protein